MLGEPKWTQGRLRSGPNGPHFFKAIPERPQSFINNISKLVLENRQGRVGKAFQKKEPH